MNVSNTLLEKFKDTKGVIRGRKSKKGRQENGRQKHTEWSTKHYTKTNDRAPITPLKPGVNTGTSEG